MPEEDVQTTTLPNLYLCAAIGRSVTSGTRSGKKFENLAEIVSKLFQTILSEVKNEIARGQKVRISNILELPTKPTKYHSWSYYV